MQQMDPAVVRVWTVLGAIPGLVLLVLGLLVLAASGGHVVGVAVIGVAVAVLVVGAGVVPRVRFRYLRWGVADGVVSVHDGWLWRRESSVPTFRIQHVDLEQGPLERAAGVRKLVVRTASPAADVTIPGLSEAVAPDVRTELLALAREAVERYGVGGASDAV